MLTKWKIALQSLSYYWRSNFAVLLGVIAATAVLTGALIVGESMRTSLRNLTLDRLGKIDELIVSDGFFRAELANDLAQSSAFKTSYSKAIPVILFPNGTVEASLAGDRKTRFRVGNVNVIAVPEEFWGLDSKLGSRELAENQVIVNQQLMTQLADGKSRTDLGEFSLRIPKPTQLPADSSLGKTEDLVESLVDLELKEVIPNEGLGRFGLQPSQTDSANIFVPIEMIQDALAQSALKHKSDSAVANVILLSGKAGKLPSESSGSDLKRALQPSLEDYGMALKRVSQKVGEETAFDYFSLTSDRLVISTDAVNSIESSLPESQPVFTYLANDIRKEGDQSGIPFSMVVSIDFGKSFPLVGPDGKELPGLSDNEVVLNEWAAQNIEAKVGDTIEVEYFEPETTHGAQVSKTAKLLLTGIAKLTSPIEPFEFRRRRVTPAKYDTLPTLANDPDLTPEVPGVTDAETIEKWELPFETADKLRPDDDDYWNYFRTTPKAFVSLKTGQKLWASRFGKVTSFRVDPKGRSSEQIGKTLLSRFDQDQTKLGFELIPIKRSGLKASSGSTPFDVLFLALSMFVIGSALILVSLLFRLGLQARANEVGIMKAVGMDQKSVLGIWLREMTLVCFVGAVLGILVGIGYAALMILGLKTWWVGAISKPIIELHVGPVNLVIGLASGIAICILTIWWSLRRSRRQPIRSLLVGELETPAMAATQKSKWGWLPWALFVVAIGLSVLATQLAGDAQAGAFMGSGFMVLSGLLMMIYGWLCQSSSQASVTQMGERYLAWVSAKRNPLRSTLTIGLVAVAAFLIGAVSSFRLAPTESGTGGFDWIAESSQPLFADLDTVEGQEKLLGKENLLPTGTNFYSMRFKPGQDASCNNLYQSTQPRVLGVTEQWIKRFDEEATTEFAWGASEADSEEEKSNPWRLLNRETDDGSIPVLIDKNTANYSLKIFATGGNYEVTYDSGETVSFKVVGFLSNTILQGSLIVSEDNFVSAFPNIGGYRYFLIDTPEGQGSDAIEKLESRLGDQGFDARSAPELLSQFMKVQNNYLSAFQSLGALGLLLGTFGLAAVQIRNVVERRRELGLMRAVGFSRAKLAKLILYENGWLLLLGLGAGILSALFSTLPHYFVGSASMPWSQLLAMFGLIVIVGLVTAWYASRSINRIPLLDSLR